MVGKNCGDDIVRRVLHTSYNEYHEKRAIGQAVPMNIVD